MAITYEQWDVINILATVMGSLGMTCSLVTIITFLKWSRFRDNVAEIVFYSAIFEVISASAYTAGRRGPQAGVNSTLCQWQGAAEQIGDLGILSCNVFITMDLLLVFLCNYPQDRVARLHRLVYLPLCISISLIVSLAPLPVTDNDGHRFYGDGKIWCWISIYFEPFRFYLFYIPLGCIFLFDFIVYCLVGWRIWKLSKFIKMLALSTGSGSGELTVHKCRKRYAKKVSLYLLAFIIAWSPAAINRCYSFFRPTHELFILNLLQACSSPSVGIFNFSIYMHISLGRKISEMLSEKATKSMGHLTAYFYEKDEGWTNTNAGITRIGEITSFPLEELEEIAINQPATQKQVASDTVNQSDFAQSLLRRDP